MKGKFFLVYFLLLFAGASLFLYGLKVDTLHSEDLQRNFEKLYSKTSKSASSLMGELRTFKGEDIRHALDVVTYIQNISSNVELCMSLLAVYNSIDSDCSSSKKRALDYIKKKFSFKKNSNKGYINNILEYQKYIKHSVLLSYLTECISFNRKYSDLLSKFK